MNEVPEYKEIHDKYMEEQKKIEEYQMQCKDEVFDLMKQYFYDLWNQRKGKKMAWYAELKRRQWYCIHGFNAISLYINYLNEVWWNSLTEDQKQHYHELKEKKRIRDREKLNSYLSFMKSACVAMHAEDAMDRISDVEKIVRKL